MHARLRGIDFDGDRACRLLFAGGTAVELAPGEAAVLAVPPAAASGLVPELATPAAHRAIVNAHFRLPQRLDGPDLLGLIGGLGQWVFVRHYVASVTVSAANGLAEEPNEAIATRLWAEVCSALELGAAALPRWRIVKEKRATFAQTPAEVARRPGCRTRFGNLFLAGDWTDTGLPATLEGSVLSGNTAAATVSAAATTS